MITKADIRVGNTLLWKPTGLKIKIISVDRFEKDLVWLTYTPRSKEGSKSAKRAGFLRMSEKDWFLQRNRQPELP